MLIISYRPGDDQLFNRYMKTAYSVSDEIHAFKVFYEKYYG